VLGRDVDPDVHPHLVPSVQMEAHKGLAVLQSNDAPAAFGNSGHELITSRRDVSSPTLAEEVEILGRSTGCAGTSGGTSSPSACARR
jgi:hypothetical protein